MRKIASVLAVALAGALVSGCSADQCDPSTDPGFFAKIGCVAGGGYSKRVEAKKQEIADLRAEQQALTEEVMDLNDEDAVARESRAKSQARLDRINEKLDALEAKVAASGREDAKLRKQIADAKSQVKEMKQTPEDATILQKEAELAELKDKLQAITDPLTAPGISPAY
jgi:chromosome segregation ATPase